MHPIATIMFEEVETREQCFVAVRATAGSIAITLSRRLDGDVQVIFPVVEAHALAEALSAALRVADSNAE